MSRIDELITELCPDGVPHFILSEVAEYSRTRVDAVDLDETNFVGVDNLVVDKGGRVDATYLPNTDRLTAYEPGDVLLGNIRPYLKKVWLATNSGGCSGDVLSIRINPENQESLDSEFLYYLLSSDGFFAYNMQHAKGAKMPRGNKIAILSYRIPVPPLEIQREIVRILDTFSKMEAELEAELEARKQQYEHYLSELFEYSPEDVEFKVFTDVGSFSRGGGPQKKDFVDSGVGCIHYGQIYTHYGVSALVTNKFVGPVIATKSKTADPNDVIIAVTSENDDDLARSVAWLGKESVVVSNHTLIYKSNLDPRYVSYFLRTRQFDSAKRKFISGTKVRSLPLRAFDNILIPVPPLEDQVRLADDLDKFDALVHDLSVGLPAELAARRQQYEYYRDKLLTFKELETAS